MIAVFAAVVLAAVPVAADETDVATVARACQAPADALRLGENGRVRIEAGALASYGQMTCVLERLQARGVHRIDLITAPQKALEPRAVHAD